MSALDLSSLAPELALTLTGILVLLLEAFIPATRRLVTPLTVAGTLIAAWLAVVVTNDATNRLTFGGQLEASGKTLIFSLVVLVSTGLTAVASEGFLRRERIPVAEYQAMLLWAAVGMLLMVRAQELLTIFICLELFSICLYALAAFHRQVAWSLEAAIKYFLMGAFVSAFVLLGIGIIYGETASTALPDLAQSLEAGIGSRSLLTLALLLLIAGFGFKMSLVPFHAWSPDTYQGAPSPFVAFLSVAPKVASAFVMLRLLEILGSNTLGGKWPQLIAILAVMSMVLGNLLALVQRDIKRMLAYSGISHMGYVAIALARPTETAWAPIAVYLLAYALMNAGAFAAVALLYRKAGEPSQISDLAGYGYRYPVLAACLAISMLSLGGIPPTFGFIGKYMVFLHAIEHGALSLAIVGVIASLVGVFYYLRVVYTLYMKPEGETETLVLDGWGRLAAWVAAAATLVLGVWPGGLLRWMFDAVAGAP